METSDITGGAFRIVGWVGGGECLIEGEETL